MKTRKFKFSLGRISIVEIDRETDSMVWVNGRGCKKLTGFESYFDTFEQAKNHAIALAMQRVTNARRTLDYANDVLGNAKGLKDPSVLNGSDAVELSGVSTPKKMEAS